MGKSNLWIGLIAGVIVYSALAAYADSERVLSAISLFHMEYIPALLALSLASYIFRFIKWHYFFRVLHLDIGFKENLWVFLSGLLMAVTPGKYGEIWKSWLIRDIRGYDLHTTMPIVFLDRITDFIAMLILASLGIFVFNMGILLFSLAMAAILCMLIVLRSEAIMLKIIPATERLRNVRAAYLGSAGLLKSRPLAFTILISLIAWFAECLVFYLTFRGLSVRADLLESIFVYVISSIAGAMTMLPGGLGVTEASLTGLSIHLMTIDEPITVAATIIARIITLWFTVGLGAVSYIAGRHLIIQKL